MNLRYLLWAFQMQSLGSPLRRPISDHAALSIASRTTIMQGGPSPGSSTARTSSQPQPGSSSTDVPAHTGTSNPLFGSSPSNEKTQQTATPPPPVSSPALQATALEAPQPGEVSRGPGAEGAWTRGLWAMDPYVSVLRMAVAYGLMVYGLGSILYQVSLLASVARGRL